MLKLTCERTRAVGQAGESKTETNETERETERKKLKNSEQKKNTKTGTMIIQLFRVESNQCFNFEQDFTFLEKETFTTSMMDVEVCLLNFSFR